MSKAEGVFHSGQSQSLWKIGVSLIMNALLDDGSTETYLNVDIAAKLGLHGEIRKSDKWESINLWSSISGIYYKEYSRQIHTVTEAFTINYVTCDIIKVVNWKAVNRTWDYLRGVNFPQVISRKKIDMFIGVDYPEFHFSLKDIKGN